MLIKKKIVPTFLFTTDSWKVAHNSWIIESAHLLSTHLLRYHAWYSRSGFLSGDGNDDGNSFPLNYDNLVGRYAHIEKDHLVKLLKQLMLITSPPLRDRIGRTTPSAADVPTLLGTGSFSLFPCHNKVNRQQTYLPSYLRWPHMQADQVRGLSLREIGGGFSKHHRAPSIRNACYAIAKASTMVQKMQNVKKLRGHRDAVYCAILDHCGRYVITGSDDRLVKIWSMETAFCLASCRGHEGDITDLSVSSNNAVVASASNDYSIRVWRLPDGYPISVLRGHTGGVTAIAFSPRPCSVYQLLSSSDDGTCRIWDARYSQCSLRVYLPKPIDSTAGRSSGLQSASASSSNGLQCHQILCCAFNANGTVFVTGSSDTFARVWSACKSNSDDPEQPSHEIDILAGHENDVNYVQFSGCAVASRSLPSDSLMEESIPKFKNSWFSHDNIVTCSRDGSAIIWIPRSRRSHGKVGRWIRAYHLKVPPPPMPPQPPRGGPRQRFLPTPRGVNMIVWSLDNRFVLAAIMDNRICVWNASDGSLVHSLTGHTASTYVLDVHPFNPRIAMSAGYDGKTILWDIWEGNPIRVYEISERFKLVDGKFSQDGTSIVLSDNVGQIYLLNTGQGESQKDAKYDQFFLGDYRPLLQDIHGNVFDQETQLAPYRRNIQDPLCDSSMLPYPEPYQSMYQRRRLGALGIEWRPSSIKFAVGTDIGIGQEFHILPLADLDAAIEPLPEFVDAMYWEPEIDVMNEDNDSEYNVTEGYSSDEQDCRSDSLSSDPECSEDKVGWSRKNSRSRSKQKKPVIEVDSMMSSGRRIKKRTSDEQDGILSRSRRYKKLKYGKRTTSSRKSPKSKSLRPQRVAARNAVNNFSQITESSTDAEDEDDSTGNSLDSESSYEGSAIQRQVLIDNLHKKQSKYSDSENISERPEDVVKPLKQPDSRVTVGNKKKLVLKFSLRDPKSPVYPENVRKQLNDQEDLAPSTSRHHGENPEGNKIYLRSDDVGSSSRNIDDKELSEKFNRSQVRETEKFTNDDNNLKTSTGCDNSSVSWGKFKLRTSKGMQLGDLVSTNANGEIVNGCLSTQEIVKSSLSNVLPLHDHQGTGSDPRVFDSQNQIKGGKDTSSHLCRSNNLIVNVNHSSELQKNPKQKSTILKIKSKNILGDTKDSSQPRIIARGNSSPGAKVELTSEGPSLGMSMAGNRMKGPMQQSHLNGNIFCELSDVSLHNREVDADLPDVATDAVCRSRSTNLVNHNFEMCENHLLSGTSRGGENPSVKDLEYFPSQEWGSMSKCTVRLRSSRNKSEYYHDEDRSTSAGRNSHTVSRKSNWLLLAEQEEGYRYIPQLGDEVVYLRQGHQEFLEKSQGAQSGPWLRLGNKIKAVEICLVEDLKYTTFGGSGDSSCQITLKFIDTYSDVVGKTFKLTLPELLDFPDFIVERNRYDAAMKRSWAVNDTCVVWWRNEIEEGGAWYEGTIVSIKDKSCDFPGSPWESCVVRYTQTKDSQLHSPWELHDPDNPAEQPHGNFESAEEILYSFTGLLRAASRDKDRYGILKLNEVARKSDFVNRFPVPLSPDIIKLRLEHGYYRSLEALRHDIMVMLSNAELYFQRYTEFSRKMKRLKNLWEIYREDIEIFLREKVISVMS
ncbi:bromodomain and WD repeat-containing 3 isoform X1 [Olea europaea subsp. europaea]|uniref:Bromodomain and WD repeat-containing 3 isoform X1 n=1 Tax=Olea europaea subsp. europaea TaxID=158383 RepID=A0A8S0TF74_OLEEU|nr:bromodomain and WD repeat-containing 3 isoform X1 [Olea europaea subsp. europaea]